MSQPRDHHRKIKSFVLRKGHFSPAQKQAFKEFWSVYGVPYTDDLLDLDRLFQRRAPLIMDIGVGNGQSTLAHALRHPENNYLAIEVHRPGVGQLLNNIAINQLGNIRIINHDVIDILTHQIPREAVSQIMIFFPDPWPKKRHHKRRLINHVLLKLISNVLAPHGRIHIATDWENYAEHIQALFSEKTTFKNLAGTAEQAPRPVWRVQTRYEKRGRELAHQVWDFCYCKT